MATVLRDPGWSTFWVGKNHNTPVDAWTMGSSKKLWPLGLGYDRFYGFIGGETSQGVIFAQGSRFGGHSLFVKGGKLHYVANFLGIPPEQSIVADAPSPGRHIVGVEFTKERMGEHHESYGPLKLYIDDDVVAEEEIRTQASRFALGGEALCIGYDAGDAVSSEYTPRFEFTGGRIVKVVFDIADDAYVDVERHLAGAIARD